jgi:replicative DNA helicase
MSSNPLLKELQFQSIATAVRQSIAIVDGARKGERELLLTKWPRLNRNLLGGLQPGKMYVIGGRPGSGKSAVSNQMIFDILDLASLEKKEVVVFYWSFEMPGYQQILRSASKDTGKQMADFYSVDRVLDDIAFEQFMRSVHKFVKYPVYFQNRPRTVKFMVEACERFAKAYPNVLIVNLIDHSRLVLDTETEKEMEKLNKLSKACMYMQSTIGTQSSPKVINILLSQLNRNIEDKERAKDQYQPLLTDLFGGDSIGQDAHVVMMIQRPNDLYGITASYCGEDPKGLLAIHMEKNRDGLLGMIPYDFDGSRFTVTERLRK